MLAKRIIACLDCDLGKHEGRVVKGIEFEQLAYAGKPIELAEEYFLQGADEICFLDITASVEKRLAMFEIVAKACERVFVPITVGGGIRSVEDAEMLFKAGADKIAVNTAAFANPKIISEIAREFGSQAVVIAIDAKKTSEGFWECFSFGGRKKTGISAIEWAKKSEELGAGEILLTSIDRDGTKKGFDLELTKKVNDAVNIPVIASGGAGSLESIAEAFQKCDVSAVLAASIFHYKKFTVQQVKEFLAGKGFLVRK